MVAKSPVVLERNRSRLSERDEEQERGRERE